MNYVEFLGLVHTFGTVSSSKTFTPKTAQKGTRAELKNFYRCKGNAT